MPYTMAAPSDVALYADDQLDPEMGCFYMDVKVLIGVIDTLTNVATVFDCQAHCDAHLLCNGFFWRSPTHSASPLTCVRGISVSINSYDGNSTFAGPKQC